jgi:hypothetical protein
VSSKEERKKKKRIWWQVCECLSEAVAHLPTAVSLLLLEALFMQISGVSLALTWPLRLCLFSVLLGLTTTVRSFPLSKHTGGGGTTPAFSSWRVYLHFTWEVALLSSPVEFSSQRCFYKLSRSWLLGGCHSCLLWPACLCTVQWGIALPHSSVLRALRPLCYMSFLLLFIFQFLFFPLGGGRSVQGAMLIWPRVVCGSTTCRLAHLVFCILPCGLGAGVWWCGSPPGFSV